MSLLQCDGYVFHRRWCVFGVELTAVTLESLQQHFLSSDDALQFLNVIHTMEPLLAAESQRLTNANAWNTAHADSPSFLFAAVSFRDGKLRWWPSRLTLSDTTLLVQSGRGLLSCNVDILNNPILGQEYTDISATMNVMQAQHEGIVGS
jgi:hypothetical protein